MKFLFQSADIGVEFGSLGFESLDVLDSLLDLGFSSFDLGVVVFLEIGALHSKIF